MVGTRSFCDWEETLAAGRRVKLLVTVWGEAISITATERKLLMESSLCYWKEDEASQDDWEEMLVKLVTVAEGWCRGEITVLDVEELTANFPWVGEQGSLWFFLLPFLQREVRFFVVSFFCWNLIIGERVFFIPFFFQKVSAGQCVPAAPRGEQKNRETD